MIGGTDIIIPVLNSIDALDLAVRAVRRLWRNVVLEDGNTGEVLPPYKEISFYGMSEVLAFKDSAAAHSWDKIGPDPSLNGTLLHFIVTPNELTVAVDDTPSLQIENFIESLRRALLQDMFVSNAEPRRAA